MTGGAESVNAEMAGCFPGVDPAEDKIGSLNLAPTSRRWIPRLKGRATTSPSKSATDQKEMQVSKVSRLEKCSRDLSNRTCRESEKSRVEKRVSSSHSKT